VVSVPEAAMNKNGSSITSKNDIGAAGQVFLMQSEAESVAVE
jgi:hypothetical protein